MNALTKIENTALSTMTEQELIDVLQSSLYPGAALESIKMVLGYCKAAGLDPMQKPVHIVPMWDSKAKQMRDVVMPGIGLYRTQAARTGEHVGTDEPVLGPMVEMRVGEFVMQHPEWCKVTVYRMVGGMKCAYTATEYWVENYATAAKDTAVPNTMWKKRTRGQIAKCAEAQALRKGFPEVGNQPTAEEMEGKVLDMGAADVVQPTGAPTPTPALTPAAEKKPFPDDSFTASMPAFQKAINKGKTPADVLATFEQFNPEFALSDAQRAHILALKPAGATATQAGAAGTVIDAKPKVTYAVLSDRLKAAADQDAALLVLDEARALPADQQTELQKAFDERFPQD